MGQQSIVYGKIVGSRFNYGGNTNLNNDPQLYSKLNRLVIDQLPATDEYPQLTREMFNLPSLSSYKNQILVFGASFKNLEGEWVDWVVKFENLLRKLYWDEAVVHLDMELYGERTFRWKNKNEPAFVANFDNTSDNWEYEGDDLTDLMAKLKE